jgi:hypothetical protein
MDARWAVVVIGALLALPGCAETLPDVPAPAETCSVDAECSAGTCARTGECLPDAELRRAQVIWTIAGAEPTAASCYWIPNIRIELKTEPEVNQGEVWQSAPLDCTLGKFTVDKLPARFWIGGAKSPGAGMWVPLDEAGIARVNLP